MKTSADFLRYILDAKKISKRELAEKLFPGNKYPVYALRRVLKGESELTLEQLATILGLPASEMLSTWTEEKIQWRAKIPAGQAHMRVFTYKDYRAELNVETWTTQIFHRDSLFHEEVIHSDAIPLRDYLIELETIIQSHAQNNRSNRSDK